MGSIDQVDERLMARVQAGDREAYADLVRRHAAAALRAARLFGAGADAEDVVQDAFIKAYAALPGFRRGAPFRPWLLTIVANEVRNLHRSAGRRAARELAAWARTAPLLTADAAVDPLAGAISAERRRTVVAALTRLPERHRQVLVCRYLLELDEEETATVLGLPRGTVKSRQHRALRRLAADPLVGATEDADPAGPAGPGPAGGAA